MIGYTAINYGVNILSKAAKIVVDNLIHDLRTRPSDFSCGRHTLKDKSNGVEY